MNELSQPQKYVLAKVMLDLNFSASVIAEELGINRSTVYRYNDKPIAEDLQQYATEIKALFSIKQSQILSKILKKIETVTEKTEDLRALVSAFESIKKHTPSLYEIHKMAKYDSYKIVE
jgi:predicted transcriptional regulator